jgi:hypothetical protein
VWWDEALGALEDPALLRRIAAVDRDAVNEEVQQHLNMCAHNPLFNPRPLRRINHGAAALCGWALALDAYCRAKKVGPSHSRSDVDTSALACVLACCLCASLPAGLRTWALPCMCTCMLAAF